MAKKIQNLKPDIVLKNYWNDNEQFADLFNAVLFVGEQVIKESEAKGRAIEIIETGFEFGISENDILNRLQKRLNISLQAAQEYLQLFGKQTV